MDTLISISSKLLLPHCNSVATHTFSRPLLPTGRIVEAQKGDHSRGGEDEKECLFKLVGKLKYIERYKEERAGSRILT